MTVAEKIVDMGYDFISYNSGYYYGEWYPIIVYPCVYD